MIKVFQKKLFYCINIIHLNNTEFYKSKKTLLLQGGFFIKKNLQYLID